MNRIQKTSKVINRILSVLFWIAIVLIGLTVIELIVLYVMRDGFPTGMETELRLGNYKLTLAEGYDYFKEPVGLANEIDVILTSVMVLYEIKVLKEIFAPMANGQPFNGSVSKSIRKMAWITLAYGIVGFAEEIVMNILIYKTLDVPSLFSPEKVSACALSINYDGEFVIAFVLLLLLSHVFRYGEELQKLSDETL